jgi:hypothetical protein
VDRGTQPNYPRRLADRTDQWHGIAAPTPDRQRIQPMASLDTETLTAESQPLHVAYLPRSQGRSPEP